MTRFYSIVLFLFLTINIHAQEDVIHEGTNPKMISKILSEYGGFYFDKSNQLKGGLVYSEIDSTMRWSPTDTPHLFNGLSLKTDGLFTGHLGLGISPSQHYFTLFHNSIRVPGFVNHPDNTAHIALIEDDEDDFARIWFLNSAYPDRWAVLARHGTESKIAFAHNGINKLDVDPSGF